MPPAERRRLIETLEDSVWKAVIAKDGAALADLFSEDYIEITLTGKRVTKDAVVQQSPKLDEIHGYSIADASVITLEQHACLISYHLTIDGTHGGEPIDPPNRWATSIWRHRDGSWKCCFFPAEPVSFRRQGRRMIVGFERTAPPPLTCPKMQVGSTGPR